MPKLQAAVPAGAPPNALLRVRLPDGNEVNVRVPEGLKPGDEFIFEVSSIGEITAGTPTVTGTKSTTPSNSGGVGKKVEGKSSKQSSKNPKKKKSNASEQSSNNRGDASSHHNSNNNGTGGAPSFVTGFFNMYNQVYDILSQNNTAQPPSPRPSISRQNSKGSNNQKSNTTSMNTHNPPPPIPQPSPQSQSQIRSAQVTSSTGAPLGFLDRELTNGKDFMTALSVGIFIGMSIVMGFLAGVLWVTPITKDVFTA